MYESEPINDLLQALIKAQREFPPIAKACGGQVGKRKFMYADLAAIKDSIDPVLAANGLLIVQPLHSGHTYIAVI